MAINNICKRTIICILNVRLCSTYMSNRQDDKQIPFLSVVGGGGMG
jgi:hypothetical protein